MADIATTTIEVTEEQADRIHARKGRGEAYRDVIQRLLDRSEQGETATAVAGEQGDRPAPNTLDGLVDRVAREWQGDTENRRKAALAGLQWLREDGGPAGATDLRDALLPEHAVDGQNESTWWRKTVRPAFQAAGDAGLVRYRPGHHDYRWVGTD